MPKHAESTTLYGDTALRPWGFGSCQGSESQTREHQSQGAPPVHLGSWGRPLRLVPLGGGWSPLWESQHRKALASELWGKRNSTNCGQLVMSPPGSQPGCRMSKPWRYWPLLLSAVKGDVMTQGVFPRLSTQLLSETRVSLFQHWKLGYPPSDDPSLSPAHKALGASVSLCSLRPQPCRWVEETNAPISQGEKTEA